MGREWIENEALESYSYESSKELIAWRKRGRNL
jgi:hypothetical protein